MKGPSLMRKRKNKNQVQKNGKEETPTERAKNLFEW